MPVCPKCNTIYEGDVRFCRTDGTPLMPLTSETHLGIGQVVNESLKVVERLRTDRFGVAYRVEDLINTGQTYSLRLFRKGLVNSRVFEALGDLAARLAAGLDDEDLLTGYINIQLEDGRYALLATDFPGTVLDSILSSEAPLTPRFVATALLRIADVLNGAHLKGFVHGNVTPENVIVVDRSERGIAVKIADFGIATTIRTHNERALTTPMQFLRLQSFDNYYAPELVMGRSVEPTVATDIFSMGALCYQMLSGWIPFTEAAIEGDMPVYMTDDPRPLTVLNKELGIPRSLEQTMLKALESDPAARHQSLAELIEILQEIEFDLSFVAPPTSRSAVQPRKAGSQAPTGLARARRIAGTRTVGGRSTDPLSPLEPAEADGADVGPDSDERTQTQ